MIGYRQIAPWNGMPRWECDYCEFDSVREDLIQKHYEEYHDFRCDQPGCDFATTDAREAKEHQETRHNTNVILTDSYGREIET